jgi:hypothetical protein
MDPHAQQLLSLATLPARLNVEQVAHYLNCKDYDVLTIAAAGLLKPLGSRKNSKHCVKYFAAVELERLHADPKWLSRVTDIIQASWRKKNDRKKSRSRTGSDDMLSDASAP